MVMVLCLLFSFVTAPLLTRATACYISRQTPASSCLLSLLISVMLQSFTCRVGLSYCAPCRHLVRTPPPVPLYSGTIRPLCSPPIGLETQQLMTTQTAGGYRNATPYHRTSQRRSNDQTGEGGEMPLIHSPMWPYCGRDAARPTQITTNHNHATDPSQLDILTERDPRLR